MCLAFKFIKNTSWGSDVSANKFYYSVVFSYLILGPALKIHQNLILCLTHTYHILPQNLHGVKTELTGFLINDLSYKNKYIIYSMDLNRFTVLGWSVFNKRPGEIIFKFMDSWFLLSLTVMFVFEDNWWTSVITGKTAGI